MDVRDQGRLAALPAGGDRRRHRRHRSTMPPRSPRNATLRPLGSTNPEPILAAMEERLLKAVNKTGFGPMGTGGDTTALAVHVDYASGHGFTPVAVCFNCWINRRTRARIYNDGDGRADRVAAWTDGRHRSLQLPLTEEAVRSLRPATWCMLDGEIVITAGLPTHQRIIELSRSRRGAADRPHRRGVLPSRQLQPGTRRRRSRCST